MNLKRLELFRRASAGSLPSDFSKWSLKNQDGWAIAHIAARHNNLPETFNQWNLSDSDGWTVAHVLAQYGQLPS
jgi:ankyrin repeat protein